MRGNRCQPNPFHYRRGSIPARAGEPPGRPGGNSQGMPVYPRACGGTCTPSRSQESSGPTVYPRACGGTTTTADMNKMGQGLSPRVRGNLIRHLPVSTECSRSIPARAGEPLQRLPAARRVQVYPRACGGTVFRFSLVWSASGLSPRVRGNRTAIWHCQPAIRSIPARAGEPSGPATISRIKAVYPRACGRIRKPRPIFRIV